MTALLRTTPKCIYIELCSVHNFCAELTMEISFDGVGVCIYTTPHSFLKLFGISPNLQGLCGGEVYVTEPTIQLYLFGVFVRQLTLWKDAVDRQNVKLYRNEKRKFSWRTSVCFQHLVLMEFGDCHYCHALLGSYPIQDMADWRQSFLFNQTDLSGQSPPPLIPVRLIQPDTLYSFDVVFNLALMVHEIVDSSGGVFIYNLLI